MKVIKLILVFLQMTLLMISCKEPVKKQILTTNKANYLNKGKSIAQATQLVLGKNLINAIETKGITNALEFCNEKAIPLTDSMAIVKNASVKRVSDKNRNSNNFANDLELEYINQAKIEIEKKGSAKPKIIEDNNQVITYYPITSTAMCLKCHGNTQTDIDSKTLKMIKTKYPKDKAVNYLSNELRGIWVIKMDK
ncbi:DUF3365 domain-containing protein [Cellulophaga baltica]|uniref:Tll0287-like domain-containing protein n=1 Tax=Cellulophaga TaxID=104264 RepID=UPI001C0777E7|nr:MULTISPECIES: DUF3365 domain-containing protein [Cellulophaga]MBU2997094.1 DUF3365 domain-containing protein [Cellulophaga baltica]MDO6768492.1 DUF3365 domain-containing protein [Cellulophaga sp. 1_MG-2023]